MGQRSVKSSTRLLASLRLQLVHHLRNQNPGSSISRLETLSSLRRTVAVVSLERACGAPAIERCALDVRQPRGMTSVCIVSRRVACDTVQHIRSACQFLPVGDFRRLRLAGHSGDRQAGSLSDHSVAPVRGVHSCPSRGEYSKRRHTDPQQEENIANANTPTASPAVPSRWEPRDFCVSVCWNGGADRLYVRYYVVPGRGSVLLRYGDGGWRMADVRHCLRFARPYVRTTR